MRLDVGSSYIAAYLLYMFAVFAFLILAQGFSVKVAMTGVLDDHCSETYFVFSHKESLEKRR